MSITLKSNIQEVINRQLNALNILTASTPESRGMILREAIFTVYKDQMQRIFTEGKDSDGRLFGTYSKAYLKVRTKYHHSNTNINLDLTDETKNGYTVGETQNGIGLGFLNKANGNSKSPNAAQKSIYLEERYGKFFSMSYKENAEFLRVVNTKIADILRGKTR